MEIIKRCMDCGNYVPNGLEKNCCIGKFRGSVCALKEACEAFVDKKEIEDLSDLPKIDLRPKIKQRRFKDDKR